MRERQTRTQQTGFSLIEVLIAVVIMAVGLLALAQLHIQSIRYTQGAYVRSQAILMAADFFDRLRANPHAQAMSNGFNTDTVMSAPDCIQTSCDPNAFAQFELKEWADNVRTRLPKGQASVRVDADTYTVTINWIEVPDKSSNDDVLVKHEFTVGTQL